MPHTEEEQAMALAKQVHAWRAEMNALAANIAFASGLSDGYALVMIASHPDSGYADVAPELILEDALRVSPHGWPSGFKFDVLNRIN